MRLDPSIIIIALPLIAFESIKLACMGMSGNGILIVDAFWLILALIVAMLPDRK